MGGTTVMALAGRRLFGSRVVAEARALLENAREGVGPAELRRRGDSLPEPVQRYFRYAISGNAPAIRTARLEHRGLMRMRPGGQWFPVQGVEYFTVAPPGFIWQGRMRPAPFAWIEARDRLSGGRGEMLVKLCSLITMARASGLEVDQGSQLRWLAENVWFPYGFIGNGVHWDAVHDRSARVTLRHTALPVTAVVDIDDEGKITAIRADRYRDVGGGRAVLTPWFSRCSEYRPFSGFRVPTIVEVGWVLPSGEFTAFQLRVTTLDYNVDIPFRRPLRTRDLTDAVRVGADALDGRRASERSFPTD